MENINTYVVRVTTIDNLYADYVIEAENLFYAKVKARKAFFRDYPDADRRIKFSLNEPHSRAIKEIMDLIKREGEKNG